MHFAKMLKTLLVIHEKWTKIKKKDEEDMKDPEIYDTGSHIIHNIL